MSGSEFHVHGAHEHEVEHSAHNGSSSMAVATALLATVGALFSYMGGYTQANAALYKNNAAIKPRTIPVPNSHLFGLRDPGPRR